jgi:hypothetical protein
MATPGRSLPAGHVRMDGEIARHVAQWPGIHRGSSSAIGEGLGWRGAIGNKVSRVDLHPADGIREAKLVTGLQCSSMTGETGVRVIGIAIRWLNRRLPAESQR